MLVHDELGWGRGGGLYCGAFYTSMNFTPMQLPPRARYFVVVGGLACCKDDLGCAR